MRLFTVTRPIAAGAAVAVAFGATLALSSPRLQDHSGHSPERTNDLMRIPQPMATEHEALHERLREALSAGGKTGAAAMEVEKLLAPHFEEENQIALPPLGVLRQLATEGASEEMRPAIAMAQQVEAHLDRFLAEHEAIKEALDQMEAAAEAESKHAQIEFARDLRLHAQEEEEVLYPATIVIGRYLQKELGESHAD